MHVIDWIVAAVYLTGMLFVAIRTGRRQHTAADYFLGGKQLGALSLATSTIATQSSTNSLLGIPAFVGFTAGGGLIWLQYEIAVPLAMLATAWLLRPVHALDLISVYAFLEVRLGRECRLMASGVFLFFRAVATGVTVYGVALVITLIFPFSYTEAVLALMCVTVAYDVMGGMRAVVFSDVVQMGLIIAALAATLVLLVVELGGIEPFFAARTNAIMFDWGVSGDTDYGLMPMVIGGFFLYLAYYGCDQSQAQRVLSARSQRELQRVLLFAGTLRFPLVAAYCLLGLGLAAYARIDSGFIDLLPRHENGMPNFNLAFPIFVLEHFSAGFIGLVMVGIFAAAMSSIDSALNSLSAVTVEDFLAGSLPLSERQHFFVAKGVTLAWGIFIVTFSYWVDDIAPTVLEAINKIGSMAYGPLLSLFLIGLVRPQLGQRAAITGFCAGLGANVATAISFAGVSWLWWNVIGLCSALAVAGVVGSLARAVGDDAGEDVEPEPWTPDPTLALCLIGTTVLILCVCVAFG